MAQKIKTVIKPKFVIWGVAVFCVIALLGAVIYSVLLLKDNTSDSSIADITTVILGLSAVISGATSGLLNKNKGIQIGFINGIIQVFIILFFSLLFREKNPMFSAENWVKFAVILLCSAVGGIIGVNVKRKY